MYVTVACCVSVFLNIVFYFIFKHSFNKKFSAHQVLASIKKEVMVLINEIEEVSDKNFTIYEKKLDDMQALLTQAEETEKLLTKALKKASSKKIEQFITQSEENVPHLLKKESFSSENSQKEVTMPDSSLETSPLFLQSSRTNVTNKSISATHQENTNAESYEQPSSGNFYENVLNGAYLDRQGLQNNENALKEQSSKPIKLSPNEKEILSLANAGFLPQFIAERLGLSISEVSLTLSVHKAL